MKKQLLILGMVAGIVFAIIGLLAMSGALGGNTDTPKGATYPYDSGYAIFGGDYYTYSVNNSAEAAEGAFVAANNIGELTHFLRLFFGIITMLLGATASCGCGIAFFSSTATISSDIDGDQYIDSQASHTTAASLHFNGEQCTHSQNSHFNTSSSTSVDKKYTSQQGLCKSSISTTTTKSQIAPKQNTPSDKKVCWACGTEQSAQNSFCVKCNEQI